MVATAITIRIILRIISTEAVQVDSKINRRDRKDVEDAAQTKVHQMRNTMKVTRIRKEAAVETRSTICITTRLMAGLSAITAANKQATITSSNKTTLQQDKQGKIGIFFL